jgi:hypothetical protein
MPFTSETAKLYGGPRPNSGRPTTEKLEAFAAAREAIKKQLAKDAKGIYSKYLKWMDEDPATCRHAVDRILGDGDQPTQAQAINVNIGVGISAESQRLIPELRPGSLQICLSGSNGKNGTGDDSP